MNSTTSNVMPEAAQPDTPNLEPVPVLEETEEALGWTNHGGMVEQQASALEWVRESSEARLAAGDSERAALERSDAEMTDSRQAQQYSRWTGEPLGETADLSQSAGIGQSQ